MIPRRRGGRGIFDVVNMHYQQIETFRISLHSPIYSSTITEISKCFVLTSTIPLIFQFIRNVLNYSRPQLPTYYFHKVFNLFFFCKISCPPSITSSNVSTYVVWISACGIYLYSVSAKILCNLYSLRITHQYLLYKGSFNNSFN